MDEICSNIVNYLPEKINVNYDKTLKTLKNGKKDEIIISTENKTTKTIIPSNNKAIGIDIEIPAIVTRLLNFLAFFSLNSEKFIIHPFIKILTNI